MKFKLLIRLSTIAAALSLAYTSAGSVLIAAGDVYAPEAVEETAQETEEETVQEAEFLGGAAALFEESDLIEEQPLLQTAGAISELDADLELFDVWAGGDIVESFEPEVSEEAEEEPEMTVEGSISVIEPTATPTPTLAPTATPTPAPTATPTPEPIPAPVTASAPTPTPEPAAEPTPTEAPTATPTPEEEPEEEENGDENTEEGAAKGAEVAAFACQFVGNPYVYGGTSLTDGADCSGFVMSVYQNFGVSLPRSSGDYPGAAYAVENGLEGARAGDIICYRGHVAIYIGNGQIVHAYNSRKGIAITEVGYDTVIAVRRVFR